MKKFCLIIILLLIFGCNIDEQPLDPVKDVSTEKKDSETAKFYIPYGNFFRIKTRGGIGIDTTYIGEQDVFRLEDGLLVKETVHFHDNFYEFLFVADATDFKLVPDPEARKTKLTVDFDPLLNERGVFVSPPETYVLYVLDNQIESIGDEEQAKIVEEYRKEKGLGKDDTLTLHDGLEISQRIYEASPIEQRDVIEVVVKHSFKLKERMKKFGSGFSGEILFVDVKRNLTRPYITYL